MRHVQIVLNDYVGEKLWCDSSATCAAVAAREAGRRPAILRHPMQVGSELAKVHRGALPSFRGERGPPDPSPLTTSRWVDGRTSLVLEMSKV